MAFIMEGSTDSWYIEDETVSSAGKVDRRGRMKEETVTTDQLAASKEPALKADSGPGYEVYSREEDSSGLSGSTDGSTPDTSQLGAPEDSVSVQPPTPATVGAPEPLKESASGTPHPRLSKVSLAETDCLICFNRYSPCRLPKVLACQHAFCAVCLKLILRNEDHTWIITCPLCRKSTVVFGGLICSLRNQEDVLGRLEHPAPGAEGLCPPDLADASQADSRPVSPDPEDTSSRDSRESARRLVLLLLLVVMLITLILPFMYTGLLKWALCFLAVLGLFMSAVLCYNPVWRCPRLALPSWRRKEGQVASVA